MENKTEQLKVFEVVVLSLTLFVVFSILAQIFIPMNPEIYKLLNIFETISCFIFIIEWIIRFKKAKRKIHFTFWNLFDLLASIPIYYLPGLRALKIFRFIRLIKLFGSFTRLGTYFNKQKGPVLKSMFFIILIFIMFVGPILILLFEQNSDGSIKTAEDALWWTYVTITTIGYGDLYPVTTAGRILTVFITLGGISSFGIFSTLIINYSINEKSKD